MSNERDEALTPYIHGLVNNEICKRLFRKLMQYIFAVCHTISRIIQFVVHTRMNPIIHYKNI